MSEPITIVILGKVASYQKAVATWHSRSGASGTLAYDKKSYADWRSYARGQAADVMKASGRALITGPVEVHASIYKSIPASFSTKKRALARDGVIRPVTRPDLSNQLKALEDAALTGIVITDDRCIVGASISKWFSDKPRVVITVKACVAPAIQALPQDGLFGRE